MLVLTNSAYANVSDLFICENEKMYLTIGLNSVPDNTDTVYVLLEDKLEGGELSLVANIPNNTFGEELTKGLRLRNPAFQTQVNEALLTIIDMKATFISFLGFNELTCKEVE